MSLNALKVENAVCPQDKAKVMLSDGDGLFLRVRPNGSKHWFFRFTHSGKVREQCLGAFPNVKLAAARDLRDDKRQLLKAGKDPILEASNQKADNAKAQVEKAKAHTDEQARARTLRQVADEYTQTDKFRKSMSERHAKQWKSQVENHLYPHFDNGNAVVADITPKHCVQSLKAVWSSNPKTAKNLRERLEKIIGYAIWKGYRDGPNPAVWADNLEHEFALPKGGSNHPALPFEKVADFLESLRAMHHARRDTYWLEFVILTAARSGEAHKATWSEIDWDKRLWTIPAAHTKRKREHVVPLSTAAIALLKIVRGNEEIDPTDLVFPSKRGLRLPHSGLHTLCRRLNPAITIHGFRSTFRDWVGTRPILTARRRNSVSPT
jgi:integrase